MATEAAPPAPAPRAQNGGGGLATLFDGDGATPPAAAVAEKPAAPPGPPWPAPVSALLCKAAAIKLLNDEKVGADVPSSVAASARKITGMLSVGERAWIQRTGAGSHFAEALAARIALDAAAAEGLRLASGNASLVVDAEALSALMKVADEAASRLQAEANSSIAKGEVENLQLVTAASASLSRDLLNLKEAADRLRGVGAAPRLGAGALDPDVVLPGQQPRPRPPPGPQAPVPIRPELRDFRGLDHRPGRWKGAFATLVVIGAVALAANAFYFSAPRRSEIPVESVGRGVQRIIITGDSAVVTVTSEWLANQDTNLPRLVQALRAKKVSKALVMLSTGGAAGIVDVESGKPTPLQAPK